MEHHFSLVQVMPHRLSVLRSTVATQSLTNLPISSKTITLDSRFIINIDCSCFFALATSSCKEQRCNVSSESTKDGRQISIYKAMANTCIVQDSGREEAGGMGGGFQSTVLKVVGKKETGGKTVGNKKGQNICQVSIPSE